MMNGKIFNRKLTKVIKAYFMCANNGIVYKGFTEWIGNNLSDVKKYISGEPETVWLNDSLLLIGNKDSVIQGETLNRAYYKFLPDNKEVISENDTRPGNNALKNVKPDRIFAGNLVVLKLEAASLNNTQVIDITDKDILYIENVLRPIERIYAGKVYLKNEKNLKQKGFTSKMF